MFDDSIPSRVRVLILGGGIHGVGLLHDMASRGWQDIFLVEKGQLGEGTSGRSTKLIHGGLRYLRRVSQFTMVSESLRERRILMEVAPDLVKPLEFFFPIMKGGTPAFMVGTGLFLYNTLAGKRKINRFSLASREDIESKVPIINPDDFSKVFTFWDAQTDDMALVRRVAASARKLGGRMAEKTFVTAIRRSQDGWEVDVKDCQGSTQTISALYVVNCLGPWSNKLLEQSGIKPSHKGINNKGVHLVVEDLGLKSGLFLESPSDKRVFFVLPWLGKTLIGTTEEIYEGDLNKIPVRDDEIEYLLKRCNRYLRNPLTQDQVISTFAGLRWLAVEEGENISTTSRESVVGEIESNRGLLMTLYGGKLTSYRSLCSKMGDRITKHFGEFRPSQTDLLTSWVPADEDKSEIPKISQRWQDE